MKRSTVKNFLELMEKNPEQLHRRSLIIISHYRFSLLIFIYKKKIIKLFFVLFIHAPLELYFYQSHGYTSMLERRLRKQGNNYSYSYLECKRIFTLLKRYTEKNPANCHKYVLFLLFFLSSHRSTYTTVFLYHIIHLVS